jgi:hypothetical protein
MARTKRLKKPPREYLLCWRWECDNVENFYCGDCQQECSVLWGKTIQLCLFGLEPEPAGAAEWETQPLRRRRVGRRLLQQGVQR